MPPAHKPMLPILTRPFALVASVALMTLCADTLAFRDDAFQPDAEPPVPSSVGERSEAEWSEGRVTLPPWPQDGDLQAFTPEGTSGGFRLYIDSRNLSIDPSGDLVRYTLVAESATGSRNVSFEGIRCTIKGAHRVYAYGASGRFSRVESGDWVPLAALPSNDYRNDLWLHRFCVYRETRAMPKRDILRALAGDGSSRGARGLLGE